MSASSNMSASTGSFSARSRRSRMPTPSKPAPIDPTGKIYSIDIDVQNDAIVNPELNQMIKALVIRNMLLYDWNYNTVYCL